MTENTVTAKVATSNNNTTPYYLLYPTPIVDREESHRRVSPKLDEYSFEPTRLGKYMSDVAERIASDERFDRMCAKAVKR